MRNQQDSGFLRRRMYLMYHQDGLLDIAVGAALLILAVVIRTELIAFIGLVGIPAAMYVPLKQLVSIPRIGYVRFAPERAQRLGQGLALALGLIALIGVLVIAGSARALSAKTIGMIQDVLPIASGVGLGLALASVAFFLRVPRFYAYGLTGLALVWLAHFAGAGAGGSIALLGTLVEIVGIVLLSLFTRRYPVDGGERNG